MNAHLNYLKQVIPIGTFEIFIMMNTTGKMLIIYIIEIELSLMSVLKVNSLLGERNLNFLTLMHCCK